MRLHPVCLLVLLLVGVTPAAARAPVEVVGLFKDRAVVRVAGTEEMLQVGRTSASGVHLVSADAHGAVVRYRDQTYRLLLSDRVGSRFHRADKREISIASDELGQYRVRGSINDQFVPFLVDTGATIVALSSVQADQLGIDYRRGQLGRVQTAQGETGSYFVILDKIDVGGIVAHNVQAAVVQGAYPTEVLLGMSFLREVSIQEDQGIMQITKRY